MSPAQIPAAAMLFKIEGWAWDAADFIITMPARTGLRCT